MTRRGGGGVFIVGDLREAESAVEEERNLAAQAQRTEAIAAIRRNRHRGMSRRRLIEIYGADLVDMVLGYDPEA